MTVENIGRVFCICSDKTGTITEGQLQLAHGLPSSSSDEKQLLSLACLAARTDCGDPMDEAIFKRANQSDIRSEVRDRVATFPFTEDRKQSIEKFGLVHVLGAKHRTSLEARHFRIPVTASKWLNPPLPKWS